MAGFDRPTDRLVVVDHDHAVACGVNVQFHGVDASIQGSEEGGKGILEYLSRCAAMADALDAAGRGWGHGIVYSLPQPVDGSRWAAAP
jgi:hypothetical protein